MALHRPRRLSRRSLGLLVCLLTAAVQAPAAAAPAPVAVVERDDDDLILLEVTLNQYVLSHDLATYPRQDGGTGTLVPLGELARTLGIAVTVTPEAGTAEGFVLSEDRRFALDVARGVAKLGSHEQPFDPKLVEVHGDDVYVDSALIGQWLPVALVVDRFGARLKVSPKELLPLQLRLEREGRIPTTGFGLADVSTYPRQEAPYRLWGWPTIDQQLDLTMRGGNTAQPGWGARYATLAAGELLFMSGQLFVAGSERQPLTDFRLTMDRKDPGAGMLGPLRATEVSIGQFAAPALSLGAANQGTQGLGVLIGNYPLSQPNQFDRHTFRGNVQPGWDVELYRGDVLLGHTSGSADGLYAFTDVPLLVGLNDFRLVFYGPQGQRREEVHSFNVSDSITPPGQHRYRVASQVQTAGGLGATAQYDVGLTQQLSASLGAATAPGPAGQQQSVQAGLRGFHGAVLGNVEVGLGPRGVLGQTGMQTRLGPLNLNARHARSWESLTGLGLRPSFRSQTGLRLDGLMWSLGGASMGLAVDTGFDESRDGDWQSRLGLPLSVAWGGISATHRLDWALMAPDPAQAYGFQGGTLQVGTRWDAWGLRGDLSYGRQGLQNLSVTGDGRRLPWDYNLSATVGVQPQGGDVYGMVSVSKDLGVALFGMDASNQGMGLTLSSAMQTDPAYGPLRAQSTSQSGSAGVLARAFLDLDRDGVWDAGEQPLEGVGITAGGRRAIATGPDGTALLAGLPIYGDIGLSVLPDTLGDAMWNASRPSVTTFLRPGQLATIDFPIVGNGEVNGTIFLKTAKAGPPDELAGVKLELVDAQGAVAMKTSSAYDGFYTLYGIAPGTYQLRIPPDQFRQGPPRDLPTKAIVIAPQGSLVEGLDIVLELDHAKDVQPPPPPVPVAKPVYGPQPRPKKPR